MRGLTITVVIAAIAAGVFARTAAGGIVPVEASTYDSEKLSLTPGAGIGPFTLEALEMHGGDSLRMSSPQCGLPSFLTIEFAGARAPDEHIASLFPASDWRAIYVYQGEISDSFSRIPAWLQHLGAVVTHAIKGASRDAAHDIFFVLHTPRACAIEPSAGLAASNAVLASIRRAHR